MSKVSAQFQYTVAEHGAIFCENGQRYFNRPLYNANRPSFVLTGDRPQILLAESEFECGCLRIALLREGKIHWGEQWSRRRTWFFAGTTEWELSDDTLPGICLRLTAVPLEGTAGFGVKVRCAGQQACDVLVVTYGGVRPSPNVAVRLDPSNLAAPVYPLLAGPDAMAHFDLSHERNILLDGFAAEACQENHVRVHDGRFEVTSGHPSSPLVVGACSLPWSLREANARHGSSEDVSLPYAWAELPLESEPLEAVIILRNLPGDVSRENDPYLAGPEAAWQNGLAHAQRIARRVAVHSPDRRVNTSVSFIAAALSGSYYPPMYMNGAMAWNRPFLGWRIRYGATAFGWHEHVLSEGRSYLAFQREHDRSVDEPSPSADGKKILSPPPHPRFWGRGHIEEGQYFYNMQEVYFDQLIHAWRWSGDREFERVLLPALEKHLAWQRDCFDPDGNGVYESYINVWASDSIWYNGGDTAQATAYAYAGYKAAMEMAERAGETDTAEQYKERLALIRQNMLRSLWIPEYGYLAEYRDTMGHRHRHDDASLYTICLPIDAGMMEPIEQVQMMHYTEWGLERVPIQGGGELCWCTNFVPYVWSVRELDLADTLHLALASYQAGMGQAGWRLLEGCIQESMYNSVVPGGILMNPLFIERKNGDYQHATDFAEPVSMLARVLVEGLFGYRPDIPYGRIDVAPQLPQSWEEASIETPDVSLSFVRAKQRETYRLTVRHPAQVRVTVPVRQTLLREVLLNGQTVAWEMRAGYENALVSVDVSAHADSPIEVLLVLEGEPLHTAPLLLEGRCEQSLEWTLPKVRVIQWLDPQQALQAVEVGAGGTCRATLSQLKGHHTVFALVETGNVRYWQQIHLVIHAEAQDRPVDTNADVARSARWAPLDISAALNADVRTIYQQSYTSPRPPAPALTIGEDGYSAWTYWWWNKQPPVITFDTLKECLNERGQVVSQGGIPFQWSGGDRNIAFTSLWDNWPTSVCLPVGVRGDAVWVLIAGTTNQMQTKIANAHLRYTYENGDEEVLELVHPANYWSLSEEYDYALDAFALPAIPPDMILLGTHCRAIAIGKKLAAEHILTSVTLECLSQDVVIGIMGITIKCP